ncbi:ubiquinol-cytochrome-c reductase complex assembly factor 1 [Formica exsecta]|uniref:ubiquinol-cytochrome-c reductase complex assembly factor 1 n=1 Tax=Formica exsecta TaxID=72781 RepID=UPI001142F8FF|nr:ubiquinol-cytochrome-c reductase complex assembly factor 1 [Formica exsecta]
MFVTRSFSQLKNSTLMLTQKVLQIRGDLGTARLLPAVSTMHLLKPKSIYTTAHCKSTVEVIQPLGPIERVLKKIGVLDIQKYRYMAVGNRVYENVVSQIDYPFFYKHFNMADTFFSWFLVTELHVWMIIVRYMAEGNAGKLIRKSIVTTLWQDTNARAENLGKITEKLRNKQIKEISEQFNAALIGYDEGIQSDDKVLAAALWRRFFHLECNNPEHIETLIIYVRKQIYLFDNLPSHEILKKPILKLIDIKDVCKHQY